MANQIVCRTRATSLAQQGLSNFLANFAFLIEYAFGILLLYCLPVGKALNTRSIPSPLFAVPAMSFAAIIIFYDEVKKLYIRKGIQMDPVTQKIEMKGWIARNTLY